jgi:hypothetical protein
LKGRGPKAGQRYEAKTFKCEEGLAVAFGEDDDKEGDEVVER